MNRKILRVLVGGERLTMAEIAARYGIKRATVRNRYYSGWPIQKIIKQPVRLSGRGVRK